MGGIDVSTNNGVQVIKFNRPEKRNAITPQMYDEITARLNNSAKDDSVILTVLTGNGNFYSSGSDFSLDVISGSERYKETAGVMFQKFVAAFIDYPKLLIAVVNGPAVGIAVTTLAHCDVVYASDKAWFQTPFSRMGLIPEACSSFTFPRMMGPARASKLLYLSETMTASEAVTCGLVTQIFPDSELTSKTSTLIQEIAKLPLEAMQVSKHLVRKWDKDLLHKINEEESKALLERFESDEFLNAIVLAFNKKKSKM